MAGAVDLADEKGSVEVGSITADILRGGTPAGSDRGVESTLGNKIADVYLWATSNEDYAGTPADIAIMNPGGLRTDLLYGEDGSLTYRDVANVQPFANTLVTVDLTGAQLKTLLEQQWRPDGSRIVLQISNGFTYTMNPTGDLENRASDLRLNGVAIDPAASYRVLVNNFLAGGGDGFTRFAEATDVTGGPIDLDALVDYFGDASPIAPPAADRITVAP